MFRCMECGKKFKTVRAAELAQMNGCPRCNSSDIDLDDEASRRSFRVDFEARERAATFARMELDA